MENEYKNLAGNVYEMNGTLYHREGNEYTPMRFDVHDGGGEGPDGDIINHENVQACGWEVGENPNRKFRGTLCWPSDCFENDIEQADGLTDEEIEAVKKWAADDLEEANRRTGEYLKPMERESIELEFSEWYGRECEEAERREKWHGEKDERKDEDFIEEFIEADQNDELENFGLIEHHDEDEIREICRNWLDR